MSAMFSSIFSRFELLFGQSLDEIKCGIYIFDPETNMIFLITWCLISGFNIN